ncbi:hypothetical protein [Aquimarina brevivitae]|uniref:Four helix bundle protein n=1 Tax=Aquimarina brevivitae TaxID=323412 RepID=A0A4Q7PI19_9FLAO|nr:hypothetical protein [Aquimarina brevivitae]RZT00207.1 hypothetical protein EV197_1443 [Aquimarina brevivitae]
MDYTPRNKKLYAKALDILSLSRNISDYLIYDLAHLDDLGNEDPNIYFTGDIVRHSNSLAPEIINAENKPFQEERIQHAYSLVHLTERLYHTCERLERAHSNGKDFLILLRKELKKFRRLQKNWMLSL